MGISVDPRIVLDPADLGDDVVQCCGHQFVHRFEFMTLDEMRRIAVTAKQVIEPPRG